MFGPSYYGLLVRPHVSRRVVVASPPVAWLPLPLSSVEVTARAFDFCSEVTVKQTYKNASPCKLDSEYLFPLDENSAVCGFTCDIDGRRIHGIVKEKSEARREFNQAKSQGKSTMLLEQKQENVFKISIGNLPPNSKCEITLTYITTLDLQGTSNRMVIPSIVAPKYQPHQYFNYNRMNDFNDSSSVVKVVPSVHGQLTFFQSMTAQYSEHHPQPMIIEPDPSTIVTTQQRSEPQRFSMKIEVSMPSEILSIKSESHQSQIKVDVDPVIGAADENGRLTVPHHATILFGMNADGSAPSEYPESLGSRDFILTVSQKKYLDARAVIEVDPDTGSQAIQLAFCPQTIDLMDASSLQVEIIFLIDQSGSMSGSGIAAVKSCLGIFLRSLPVACRFNLVSFGSTYKKLFPQGAQPYSESTIQSALAYASSISADLGGTEIMSPLRDCFESKPTQGYPRQIFLLTDGQVTNTQELIDLTRRHASHARLFTFGLGSSVDRHLVKSLASAGRGECEFVSGGSSQEATQDTNSKVMRNLIRAMQPSITDVKVDWSAIAPQGFEASSSTSSSSGFFSSLFGKKSPNSERIMQCPETITPIFPPNREIIYALGGVRVPIDVTGTGGDQIVNIRVSGYSNRPCASGLAQGRIEWSIPLNIGRPQIGNFLHKLAARARISEIQNWTTAHHHWKDQKSEVLKLALKYQLLSNYTAFIIVDDRKKNKKTKTKKKDLPDPNKQVLVDAQVNMLNAFLSNQTNPNLPVNSNGFAFEATPTPVPAVPVAPSVESGVTVDDDDDSSDEEYESDLFQLAELQPVPQQQSFGPAVFGGMRRSSGAPPSAPGGGGFSFGVSRSAAAPTTRGGSFGSAPPAAPNANFFSFGAAAPTSTSSSDLLGSFGSAAPSCSAKSLCRDESEAFSFGAAPPPPPPSAGGFGGVLFGSAPPPPPAAAPSSSFGSAAPMQQQPIGGGSNLFTVLVQMVCIDGTWNLTAEFLTLISQIATSTNQSSDLQSSLNQLSVASLTSLASSLSLTPKAIATLIAIWAFQTCFAPRSDEWMMMVGKAKGQLRTALGVQPEQIENITKQIIVTP